MPAPVVALAAKVIASKAASETSRRYPGGIPGLVLTVIAVVMVPVLVLVIAVTSALGALVQIRDGDGVCLPPDLQTIVGQEQVQEDGSDDVVDAAPTADIVPASTGRGSVVFPVPEGAYILTSPYGMRKHPITGKLKMHKGMDFAAQPRGSKPPILAVADGKVVVSEYHSSWGNHVRIEHNLNGQRWLTLYAHMDRPADVRAGQTVKAGQRIGFMGTTGSSTGVHLHLEVWKDSSRDQSTDPAPWLRGNGVVNVTTAIGSTGGGAENNAVICEVSASSGSSGLTGGAGPWGGHENGRIPASELCAPNFLPNHRFRCDAARALERLNEGYKKDMGENLSITDSYRDYEGQVRCREQKGALCATPGTSNHGWAMAMDAAGGIEKFGTPQHQWMVKNAAQYGWAHPSWAQQSGSKPEPWHWEYIGIATTGATGDIMTVAGAQAYARSAVLRRGWSDTEYSQCLAPLWHKESTWNYKAKNPSSSAVGIPQMMGSIWLKDANLREVYMTNPRVQIDMGLDYIADRYKKPCAAWDHSKRLNWY